MTRHAHNGFMATSVADIDQIARICALVGADAEDVSRGPRCDVRIGPRGYLCPDDAVTGGTLARDVQSAQEIACARGFAATRGVGASNATHRTWARGTLTGALGLAATGGPPLPRGRRVAVSGRTDVTGTTTLRRSAGLEVWAWLEGHGAHIQAHDPAVAGVSPDRRLTLTASLEAALQTADALVVCTGWPEYRQVSAAGALGAMWEPVDIDAAGDVRANLDSDPGMRYTHFGIGA
jgi:UDPglucose 6-dehydrogenase